MPGYGKIYEVTCFRGHGENLENMEKTRLYQAIRSYEKYGKNIIYLPWQDLLVMVKCL